MKNKYNLYKYIVGQDLINKIVAILGKEDIDTDMEINAINILADFIQNNTQYSIMDSFNKLVDITVDIIESFNSESINEYSDKKYRVNTLMNALNKFYNDISSIKINLYFYGKDKYNIKDRCFNKKLIYVENINDCVKKLNEDNSINILIVSEETIHCNIDFDLYFDEVIYYDKLMNSMFEITEKIYYENYDYNYLLKSIENCEGRNLNTLIVGNSYPLTGIDCKLLSCKSISLALSSQDLYYSYKLAKKVIAKNKNIKNCIIGAGYYLVNHDLSKCKSDYSKNLVKNVYYPILKDKHNSDKVEDMKLTNLKDILKNDAIDYIFNLDFLDYHFRDLIYRENNGYFNNNCTRENNSILRGVKLSLISEDEKYRIGEIRANQHNDLSKYTETAKEYNSIFDEFILFLKENDIEPIIVVFPSTKYYTKFVNKIYENEFYNIINGLYEKYEIKLVDFTKIDMFEEDDFIDFDHMSESGAIKVTKYINKILV